MEDDERKGYSRIKKANIKKVRKLKIQRPKSLAEELHIDKEPIRQIFIED